MHKQTITVYSRTHRSNRITVAVRSGGSIVSVDDGVTIADICPSGFTDSTINDPGYADLVKL